MKSIVVAIDKHNAIGTGKDMPWGRALPDDLERFKTLTTGGSIIVGRGTFENDFHAKPLPNRENIVITSKPTGVRGVLSADSLEAAYALARYPIFVVGGGQVYAAAIDDMDILYVTEVDAEFPDATVFFPSIDKDIWQEVGREHHVSDDRNAYSFDFVEYQRKT